MLRGSIKEYNRALILGGSRMSQISATIINLILVIINYDWFINHLLDKAAHSVIVILGKSVPLAFELCYIVFRVEPLLFQQLLLYNIGIIHSYC